jgi:LmbE family N-acetylglucosaminyl deacetylase
MEVAEETLILSPHCDDAPLSLGAALLTGRLGPRPQVAIVFSRSRFAKGACGTGSEEEITTVRTQEERNAAHTAGYGVEFWGFGEPLVRLGVGMAKAIRDHPARALSSDPAWLPVCAAIEGALSSRCGLVMAPLACGMHIDHRIVRDALVRICIQYPHLRVGFYEDLPYCDVLSDEQILAMIPALPGRRFQPHIVSVDLERKIDLVRIYNSQPLERFVPAVERYWGRRGGERFWIAA